MSKKQTTGKKKSVIQNYGLFWRKDRVNWKGKKGSPVSLCGVEKNNRTNRVDFREQRGIYALYADYKLVYVGQTTRTLYERLNQHRQFDFQGRWDMFSWFGTRYVTQTNALAAHSDTIPQQPKTDILDMFEGLVIAISEPRLNSQGPEWNKFGITQYYQWWEEE